MYRFNLKLISKLLLIFCCLTVVAFTLMAIVYLLPTKMPQRRVKWSVPIFQREGTYFEPLCFNHGSGSLDNFTDALMLLTASHKSSHNFIIASNLAERKHIADCNPTDTLIKSNIENTPTVVVSYERYWHGYLVYLKPLLQFLDYGQIRYFIMSLQILLMFFLLGILCYKKKINHAIALAITWLFMTPVTLFLSIQNFNVSIIVLMELSIILIFERVYTVNRNLWMQHFLIVGSITSFLDLLTYPLVTFGIPVAYLLFEYGEDLKDRFTIFMKCGLSWILGYLGLWSAKWILGSIILRRNIVMNAINQIKYRSGTARLGCESISSFTYYDVFLCNLRANVMLLPLVVLILVLFYKAHKKKLKFREEDYILPLIALLPFCWYIIAANHSHVHCSIFTYRELAITIYSLYVFVLTPFLRNTKLIAVKEG